MDAHRIETRQAIQQLYVSGRVDDAADRMAALIRSHPDTPDLHEHKLLLLYRFAKRDYAASLDCLHDTHRLFPRDADTMQNIARILMSTGRVMEALVWLERARALRPDRPMIHDGLTEVYGRLGNHARARHHGQRALALKDASAAARPALCDVSQIRPPAFRPDRPRRNVIAFSLWGQTPRYLDGAVRNAQIAPRVYPGWRCRFYCGRDVPGITVAALLEAKADVIVKDGRGDFLEGLFWRFDVASDPSVDRFLVRDADSVINPREAAAVAAWLDSGALFHAMRDYFTHTDLLLAGMWGGTGGLLPDLAPHYAPYLRNDKKTFNCDQKFLGDVVWPTIRRHTLVHDSWFRTDGSHPFPANAPSLQGGHVGQNENLNTAARA